MMYDYSPLPLSTSAPCGGVVVFFPRMHLLYFPRGICVGKLRSTSASASKRGGVFLGGSLPRVATCAQYSSYGGGGGGDGVHGGHTEEGGTAMRVIYGGARGKDAIVAPTGKVFFSFFGVERRREMEEEALPVFELARLIYGRTNHVTVFYFRLKNRFARGRNGRCSFGTQKSRKSSSVTQKPV